MKRISKLLGLNSEQQQLIDIDNSYVVQAGAGSGKTRVLVSRYLQILESGKADVSQIVAITFTVNAANEMKERIKEYANNYIDQYGEKENINNICLRDISDSLISTIHGFAARIIRENPYECNISSKFKILEGLDQRLFIEQSIDVFLAVSLDTDKNLAQLFENENYNYISVKNKIKEILELTSRHHIDPSDQIKDSNNPTRQIDKLLKTLFKEISNGPYGSENKKIDSKIKEFNQSISNFNSANVRHDKLRYLQQSKLILSNQNSPKGILELKSSTDIERRFAAGCAEITDHIINLYDIENTNNYLRIFLKFYEFYQDRKKISGFLEFEDLLRIVFKLFKNNPELLEEYEKKYKYFLVDEFQDIDKLQYEIIDLFSDSTNKFIVGDPKQSIFGFRGANPDIFKKLQISHDTSVLSYNYRSDYRLINFYNEVFKIIIKESYEKMKFISDNNKSEIVKEIIYSEAIKGEGRVLIESKSIAQSVSDLIDNGYDKKDIAILLRSKSNIGYIENALSGLSIPYYSSEKTGFYRYQEIRDIVSLLKYLINQNDKISEASVLRSTFLGATDSDLLNHYVKKNSVSLIDGYLNFISKLRNESISKNPLELLINILKKTCYWSAMLALPKGREKYESIRRLIEIFSQLQLRGKNLLEIMNFLDLNYEENTEGLSQLELDESDTVKILTVHKAKGLEFPVIILADINHGMGGGSESVNYSQKYGFVVKNPVTRSNIWKSIAEEQKLLTVEEEKRLLYVAMTRAKEKLIFSVCANSRVQKGSYLEILNNLMPLSKIEKDDENLVFKNWHIPIKYHDNISTHVPVVIKYHEDENIDIDSDITIDFGVEPECELKEDIMYPNLSFNINKIEIGSIMHKFLQIWDFEQNTIETTIRYVLNENYIIDEKMYESLNNLADNFLASDLYQQISIADEIKRELPFYLEIEGQYERRKIDLLIFKDGNISLFDYKLSKDIKGDYIEQMDLYEKALLKKYNCNNISKIIVHIPEVIINNIN